MLHPGELALPDTSLAAILRVTVAHPNLNSCHRDGEGAQGKEAHKGKVRAELSAEERGALLLFSSKGRDSSRAFICALQASAEAPGSHTEVASLVWARDLHLGEFCGGRVKTHGLSGGNPPPRRRGPVASQSTKERRWIYF